MPSRLSRLILVVILAFILLPAAAACKGSAEQVMSGEIKIEAGEFYFKPANITVKAGTPVKFVVTNTGKIEHNFSFEELIAKGMTSARIGRILPGMTETLEITFDQAGTYIFDCSIPGHADAGMKGTVKVVR
ncbi:MAG: cupredoxin domain-containing protein [Chloroflexi bacterium]|nr:cupredoxin domain-containing protein [Chloroflexota bacterium]